MDVKTKTCSKCGKRKPRDAFSKDKNRKHGLYSQCKACHAEYYANNKEQIRERNVKYRANNKKRLRRYHAEYYAKNKDQKREYFHNSWPRCLRRQAKHRVKKLPEYLRQPVLSAEQIEALDTGRCVYTGKPVGYGKFRNDPAGRSLDKIIPELQYVSGNVVLVSIRTNAVKQDSSNPCELERIATYTEKMLSGEIEPRRRPEGVKPTKQERQMLASRRYKAKKKGLSFALSIYDVVIPDVCPALGIPLKKDKGALCPNSPSLDRLDPSKGYVRGNVAVISHRANRIKQDASPDELRLIAKNMRAYVRAAYRLSPDLNWLMDGCDESDAERAARLHLDVAQFAWLY